MFFHNSKLFQQKILSQLLMKSNRKQTIQLTSAVFIFSIIRGLINFIPLSGIQHSKKCSRLWLPHFHWMIKKNINIQQRCEKRHLWSEREKFSYINKHERRWEKCKKNSLASFWIWFIMFFSLHTSVQNLLFFLFSQEREMEKNVNWISFDPNVTFYYTEKFRLLIEKSPCALLKSFFLIFCHFPPCFCHPPKTNHQDKVNENKKVHKFHSQQW